MQAGANAGAEKRSIYSVHRTFTGFGPLPNSKSLTFDDYVRFGSPHSSALPFRCGPYQPNSFLKSDPRLQLIPLAISQLTDPLFLPRGEKWFYEINLSHGLAYESGLLQPGASGLWASIPHSLQHGIRDGFGKLLISSIIEDTPERAVYLLFESLANDGAPTERVVLLTSAFHSSWLADDIKKRYGATILVAPVWEKAVERWHREGSRQYLESADISAPRGKKFVFLNRRMGADGVHRILAYLYLLRAGLLADSHASMMWIDVDRPPANLLDRIRMLRRAPSLKGRKLTQELLEFGEDYYRSGPRNLPLILDVSFQSNETRTWGGALDYLSNELPKFFSDSYFSVIGECVFDTEGIENAFMISEKTFTAMMNFHFFILMAEAGSLERLRHYGYRTFSPYVDETYDSIADPDARIRAITAEIQRLCALSQDELAAVYQALFPVIEHNRRVLVSRVSGFAAEFSCAISSN